MVLVVDFIGQGYPMLARLVGKAGTTRQVGG